MKRVDLGGELISKADIEVGLINSHDIATGNKNGFMSAIDKIKLDGIEVGANKTEIDCNLSKTSTNTVQNKVISNKLENVQKQLDEMNQKVTDFHNEMVIYGKNKFDCTNVTTGYVAYNSGVYNQSVSNYRTSEFIQVEKNTKYWLNRNNAHIAFFNAHKNYCGGVLSNSSQFSFTTDDNTEYIRISVPAANINSVMLNSGDSILNFEEYAKFLNPQINVMYNSTTVIVDKNNSGDYKSLVACLNAIKPSRYKPYIVILKEGTYNLREEDSNYSENNAGYIGIKVPEYVTILGFGNRDKIVIEVECDTEQTYISTLNLQGECAFENITIKGRNTRYTIHDDLAVSKSYCHSFTNVKFVGYNLRYHYCYGAGMRHYGGHYIFKDCTFECDENAFSVHNSTPTYLGDQKRHIVEFINCRFNNPQNTYSIVIHSINKTSNGFISDVYLYGDKCNGKILLDETTPTSEYGTGICWRVSGFSTTYASSAIVNTDGIDYSDRIDIV